MKLLRLLKVIIHINKLENRFRILQLITSFLVPQYRLKWPQMQWWQHGAFNEYLSRFGELENMNTDRRWMLGQLLRLTENIPGDTAECGVYEGCSSYLILQANQVNKCHNRTHHIFDSFEGLSLPSNLDGSHWSSNDLSIPIEIVQKKLNGFNNVVYHQGWIPERFPDVNDCQFSFVHIDVDLYQPTFDSVSFFYLRMAEGGILVCDDYGFTTCPGATRAIDEFLLDKKEKMIANSCGGGFFIKGCKVSNDILAGNS